MKFVLQVEIKGNKCCVSKFNFYSFDYRKMLLIIFGAVVLFLFVSTILSVLVYWRLAWFNKNRNARISTNADHFNQNNEVAFPNNASEIPQSQVEPQLYINNNPIPQQPMFVPGNIRTLKFSWKYWNAATSDDYGSANGPTKVWYLINNYVAIILIIWIIRFRYKQKHQVFHPFTDMSNKFLQIRINMQFCRNKSK